MNNKAVRKSLIDIAIQVLVVAAMVTTPKPVPKKRRKKARK